MLVFYSKLVLSLINSQVVNYFQHIARRQHTCLEKVLMEGKIEGPRRQGCPRIRWIDRIKAFFRQQLLVVYQLVADRQQWRIITEVTNYQT